MTCLYVAVQHLFYLSSEIAFPLHTTDAALECGRVEFSSAARASGFPWNGDLGTAHTDRYAQCMYVCVDVARINLRRNFVVLLLWNP